MPLIREPGAREPFKTIGSRYPVEMVYDAQRDAKRLGIKMSTWMRLAVKRLLESGVTEEEAEEFELEVVHPELQKRRAAAAKAPKAKKRA